MDALPDLEEWMEDSKQALSISLVSPSTSGLTPVAGPFHPVFTYSIFGDDEKIFGYKGLKMNLRFRAYDMKPHLQTSFSQKLKAPPGVDQPTDVAALLEEGRHLPKIAFASASDFESKPLNLADNWTPPGTLHRTIDAADGRYEIWTGSLADPFVRQLNNRIQILVPLLIEGGSYIGQDTNSDSAEPNLADANRWTFFFLYKTQKSAENPDKLSYTFMGYATVYRFFFFQRPTPPASPKRDWELPQGDFNLADLPCRSRLSQFIILPPFQNKGNGARLYKTIFAHYHKHPQTHEFTVENPNEAFDDLRDICDLEFLQSLPEFAALGLNTSASIPSSGPLPSLIDGGDALEKIRAKTKIAPRQFARVLEMHLMSKLPQSVRPTLGLDGPTPSPTAADTHQEKLWQLFVKQRLYRHNKDALSQFDMSERAEKLRDTLSGVELEYARLLKAHDRAVKHADTSLLSNGKRKSDQAESPPASKRSKVDMA